MIDKAAINPFLRPLQGYVMFIYLIQLLTIWTSIAQIHINSLTAILFLALSVLIGTSYTTLTKQHATSLQSPPTQAQNKDINGFITATITGICVLYLFLWIIAIIAPDPSWDGNSYHIPPISMWTSQGYIHWIDTKYIMQPFINGAPKGSEVIGYVLATAFGNSMINTSNLLYLPLGIIGIAGIASSIGVCSRLALAAGFLYVLIPINIYQSPTTYVDSAFAACVIALSAILVEAIRPSRQGYWARVFPIGSAIGLVLSTKFTGLYIGCLALLILCFVWAQDLILQRANPESAQANPVKVSRRSGLLLTILGIGIVAITGGGFWYIRNYIQTGSPIYPAGIRLFGHTIFAGLRVTDMTGEIELSSEMRGFSTFGRVLYAWAQGLTAWPLSLKGYDARTGGLGFLWILGSIPSIAIFLIAHRNKQTLVRTGFPMLLFLLTSAFFFTPNNWWARYTVWIYALGLPAFAWVIQQFFISSSERNITTITTKIWLLLCIALSGFEGLYATRCCTLDIFALASLKSNPALMLRAETWTRPRLYLFPNLYKTALAEVLRKGRVIAIGPHNTCNLGHYAILIGQLFQPIGQRKLIFIGPNDNIDKLLSQNIEYIIWEKSMPLPQNLTRFSLQDAEDFIVLTVKERPK